MCDYSAEHVQQRKAAVADQLVTAKMGDRWGHVGLVAPEDPETAVCLSRGTKLIFTAIPANLQKQWGIGQVAIATFDQRRLSLGDTHLRDGIYFDSRPNQFHFFRNLPLELNVTVEIIPGEAVFAEAQKRQAIARKRRKYTAVASLLLLIVLF